MFVVINLRRGVHPKSAPTRGAQKKPPRFDLDGLGGAAYAYLSRAKTDCADWLACASMAVAACWMICDLAKLVVSLA